jgi:hypothetical protein
MSARRWIHRAVVLSGLPNVNEYIDGRHRARIMALNDDDEDDSVSCRCV